MKMVTRKLITRMIYILLCVVFLCSAGVACLACDPSSFYYDYEELKESVISMELIDYNATDAYMTRSKKDIGMFDFEKSETLQTLEQSRVDEFLRAFSKIQFFEEEFPNTPIGRCVKLTYSNGDFLIVICYDKGKYCYSGTHLYDKNGNIQKVIGFMPTKKEFINLRDKFFGEAE